MVREVDHDAFGVHVEGRGNELGVKSDDQVGQASAPDSEWSDAAWIQDVADVGGGCRCSAGLCDAGDDHVGVAGVLVLTVSQAALKHCPAGRVQRHRLRPFAQVDGAAGGVEIVNSQEPDFAAGGRMEEGQDSRQGSCGCASALVVQRRNC